MVVGAIELGAAVGSKRGRGSSAVGAHCAVRAHNLFAQDTLVADWEQ